MTRGNLRFNDMANIPAFDPLDPRKPGERAAGPGTASPALAEFAGIEGIKCGNVRHIVEAQISSGQRKVGDKVPSCTDKNWASYLSGANSAASVPVSQAWLSSRTSASNSAARRLASRWAAIS